MFARILKTNPYHDAKGRFTTRDRDAGDGWQKVGHQRGSNPGGIYEFKGGSYYVKFPRDPQQVHSEVVADAVHELIGVKTMGHKPMEIGGKTASVSALQKVRELGAEGWDRLNDKQIDQAADLFMASVVTKNWDVVGLVHDNVGQDQQGNLRIIDTGGSFRFRAQGGPKDYGPDPSAELSAMQDPNKTSGAVYGPLIEQHRAVFEQAAKRLAAIPDDAFKNIVQSSGLKGRKEIAQSMLSRRQAVVEYFTPH